MLVTITGLLDPTRLARVRELLDAGRFVDGRLSAGTAARRVKHNQELEPEAAAMEELNRMVMGALVRHPTFNAAALPLRVATAFFARYRPGMTYGDHVDDPVMGPARGRYRSDVSTTVYLNAPEEYTGGELVVHTPFGSQEVKLAAGDAILYPSSSLHRVAEVTEGERLAAVTWTQSLVRDPGQRELLFTLGSARERLLTERPDAPETRQVDVAYVNLMRRWSEV